MDKVERGKEGGSRDKILGPARFGDEIKCTPKKMISPVSKAWFQYQYSVASQCYKMLKLLYLTR